MSSRDQQPDMHVEWYEYLVSISPLCWRQKNAGIMFRFEMIAACSDVICKIGDSKLYHVCSQTIKFI